MTEIWKPLEDARYSVSSLGRVRGAQGKVLKPFFTGAGVQKRLRVCIGRKQRLVHHLVLETFIGKRPEGFVACHNDGDSTNNSVANLRWDTKAENTLDAVRHGTLASLKIPWDTVLQIRSMRDLGVKISEIATKFSIAQSTVSIIANHKSRKLA